MRAPALRGYYAILDLKTDREAEEPGLLARAGALLEARPCALQLRAKTLPAGLILEAARLLLPACRAAGVPLCMNDRLDLALAAGAEMVHVGQDDLPLADVRRVGAALGRDLVVGVSTHTRAQAVAAIAGGADYLGFGPVFGTSTKSNPDPTVGLAALGEVAALSPVPVVAIGGITRANVARVVEAGASAAAVISDVERAADPAAAARALALAFAVNRQPASSAHA
jgi:thiamine-phosphate pyrophosphorylase